MELRIATGLLRVQLLHHGGADVAGGLLPNADHVLVSLLVGDETLGVLAINLGDILVGLGNDRLLPLCHGDVEDGDRHTAAGCRLKSDALDAVGEECSLDLAEQLERAADQLTKIGARQRTVYETKSVWKDLVELHATNSGLDALLNELLALLVPHLGDHVDWCVDGQLTEVIGEERFGLVGEAASLGAIGQGGLLREIEAAEHHVLGRRNDWGAVGWRQEVVRREHQLACLLLRRLGERHVDRHLVAVEVGVERRTNERMDADCRTLDEHRHECLDAESVQGWGAVEQHRVILDHVGEHLPHHVGGALGEALGALDVVRMAELNELAHDEWLEEFERHLLWNTALVQLQLWPNHDDGAARIVDALAEKVLAESPLLPLEHVAERLESVIAGAGDGASTSAVVNEGVDRLLEHALLVAHDDLRGAELDEALQSVVAVDDAAIEVVQVGGGETATVELHHWAQVWWDHRKDRHDHPLWSCA